MRVEIVRRRLASDADPAAFADDVGAVAVDQWWAAFASLSADDSVGALRALRAVAG